MTCNLCLWSHQRERDIGHQRNRQPNIHLVQLDPAGALQLEVLKGGQFDNYRDPVGGAYEGRWLAGSALVEGTDFVVIVQVKYDEVFPKDDSDSKAN